MMKTEKRKANVGERILITSAAMAMGRYANGDIATVKTVLDGGVKVDEFNAGIFDREYEVIVEQPKKSARITALESQVATLQAKVEALESASKYPLTAQFELQNAEVDAILADIERKAKPTLESILATYPSPNEQRADVIKRAKEYLEEAKGDALFGRGQAYIYDNKICDVEFLVNADKRTVVALLRWRYDNSVTPKGIAKCDPADVFNADIGKAIALARALGVDVPAEFVKAVQPTACVGQRVELVHCGFITLFPCDVPEIDAQIGRRIAKITDDTDAVYE